MDLSVWTTVFLVYIQPSLSLVCYYCYRADLRADCHINVIECPPEHVCSVESSVVTYKRGKNGKLRKQNMYRMGCEHYVHCRDRVMTGPGPYGYHVTNMICCCEHLCEEADGVGRRELQSCPHLWANQSHHSNSTTAVHSDGRIWPVWFAAIVKIACTANLL